MTTAISTLKGAGDYYEGVFLGVILMLLALRYRHWQNISDRRRHRMKISKLQKKMGQFTLQIEELYLESGKVHGLIGTNGCGKTTLSKLIQGDIGSRWRED